jgi:hypothetical protein
MIRPGGDAADRFDPDHHDPADGASAPTGSPEVSGRAPAGHVAESSHGPGGEGGSLTGGGLRVAGDAAVDLSDEALLADLRRVAAEADPVPTSLVEIARAALDARDLGQRFVALVADSAGDADTALFEAVRREPTHGRPALRRLLSFEGPDVVVEVEVSDDGMAGADGRPSLSLAGQVDGEHVRAAAIEDLAGRRALLVDTLGRFLATGVRRGPMRLSFTLPAGAVVTTAWVAV